MCVEWWMIMREKDYGMNKLTVKQKHLLDNVSNGKTVYVFKMKTGEYSFGYDKNSTSCRIYTTLTARSLVKKGVVVVKECDVEDSLDNCVGVLERV